MTIMGTIAWLILFALTWAFVRGGTMKSVREIQEAMRNQRRRLDVATDNLETDDPEEFGKAMEEVEDATSKMWQLHEELYPHKDRMIQDKIDAEPDESYDPHPGYRVGE